MIKIAIIGIAVALLGMPFRLIKGEYSLYIGLAGCLLVFVFVVGKLEQVLELLKTIQELLPIDRAYTELLLKMVGITYITEFSQDICKDAGFGAVANQIGIAGKLTLLGMSLPIIQGVIDSFLLFGTT